MTSSGNQQVVKLLLEAHSNELALVQTLQAHAGIAEDGPYRKLVLTHLRETQRHADLIADRLDALGENRSLPALAYGTLQNVLKQGLVMTKGPIDLLRGRSRAEKMLRNARDEAMTEGMEIATYDAIETVALAAGDHETAELASRIREDEERMLEALRREVPRLAQSYAQVEIDLTSQDEPWAGYDDMTVDEIRGHLDTSSEAVVLSVRDYEKRNKNRKTVIELTERQGV